MSLCGYVLGSASLTASTHVEDLSDVVAGKRLVIGGVSEISHVAVSVADPIVDFLGHRRTGGEWIAT
jgi:hypothetical protein